MTDIVSYPLSGVDQSKRLAKRAAASAMLEVLRKLPADINPGLINRKQKVLQSSQSQNSLFHKPH